MNLLKIPGVIDISAVRTDATEDEIKSVAEIAKKYDFLAAFAMPCFTELLVGLLKDRKDIIVGGVSGFPSGADLTAQKVSAARDMMDIGCTEIDMVTNVGYLKSGKYDMYMQDIKAVVQECAGRGVGVKSILEIGYLSDYEIAKGSELAVSAGVEYVKTGTGWASNPTTVQTIKLIKSTIGNSAKIKAAGGVRSLDTLLEMMSEGCDRFGIGLKSAIAITEDAFARAGVQQNIEVKAAANDNY